VTSDHLDELLRWVGSGGTVHVVARHAGAVEIALLTCSGGEEMARFRSTEPDLLAYLDEADLGA
jgi:hypothetical protein